MSFTPSPNTKVVEVDGKMNLHITSDSGNAGIMLGGASISSSSEGMVFQLNGNEHFSIQSDKNELVFQINKNETVKLQLQEEPVQPTQK
jgi:hypothetical protein